MSPWERSHPLNTDITRNQPNRMRTARLPTIRAFPYSEVHVEQVWTCQGRRVPVQWGSSRTSLNMSMSRGRQGLGWWSWSLYKGWEPGPQGGRFLYSESQCIVGNGHMGTLTCGQNDRHDWKHYLPTTWRVVINDIMVKKVKRILHGQIQVNVMTTLLPFLPHLILVSCGNVSKSRGTNRKEHWFYINH